ncbi:MAG: response regulator, partial [Anaerolineae bacterium]|nr:response regulator [Anaerolineae bacterium]
MMGLDKDDPAYHDLREVQRAAVRATNLTRQLLLFSRRQPMEMIPLDLNETIGEIMKMLKRVIGEDISITTELEDGLWTIEADPGNIEQVIMNLVVNARDAMPEGGRIRIKTENLYLDDQWCKLISFARPGNFVCLTIEDTGTGMDDEVLEHLFEPFFTTKPAGKGTGLGLPVVYGIVTQHQGWINVYSKVGQGSTFKVYLPAVSLKPETAVERQISLEAFRGQGERILLVEDEATIRKLSTRALRESGYTPFPAANVAEALVIFERENGDFALVFSDVVLPDGSGLNLVDHLLARQPDLRVLLSSGYTDPKSQWQAIRERGFPFLRKPYALSELLRSVSETMHSR